MSFTVLIVLITQYYHYILLYVCLHVSVHVCVRVHAHARVYVRTCVCVSQAG